MATKKKPAKKKPPKKKVAKKKSPAASARKSGSDSPTGKPAFPYTTKPGTLRKFLEEIPRKPKPTKVNSECLKAWGFRDTNDQSIIRVLKSIGFVSPSNEPTEKYTQFMNPDAGPGLLAEQIRLQYAKFFESSHEPQNESDEKLRNYLNIHSGGSDSTLTRQLETFKALCDHADFSTSLPARGATPPGEEGRGDGGGSSEDQKGQPVIHIDLHVHLPENKSRRDYEYMFEDIAKYIIGRPPRDSGNDST